METRATRLGVKLLLEIWQFSMVGELLNEEKGTDDRNRRGREWAVADGAVVGTLCAAWGLCLHLVNPLSSPGNYPAPQPWTAKAGNTQKCTIVSPRRQTVTSSTQKQPDSVSPLSLKGQLHFTRHQTCRLCQNTASKAFILPQVFRTSTAAFHTCAAALDLFSISFYAFVAGFSTFAAFWCPIQWEWPESDHYWVTCDI